MIIRPYPNFNNGGLTKPLLKLGYGWVITPHCFTLMYVFIRALIPA